MIFLPRLGSDFSQRCAFDPAACDEHFSREDQRDFSRPAMRESQL